MILTEAQKQIIAPKIEEYKRAQKELEESLILIYGKLFKSWSIKGDELIIEDLEKQEK